MNDNLNQKSREERLKERAILLSRRNERLSRVEQEIDKHKSHINEVIEQFQTKVIRIQSEG